MVQVQWRVVILGTVMLVGWLSAAEGNRRKVIIHIPHLHHSVHKHSVHHPQKGHGGKEHRSRGKGNGHIHKHHHHFYDDDHGGHGEPSHKHTYEEPGHHHHHPPPPPPPPPPSHHHHSHPHHYHSHPSHHHSHPMHHHSDHHGHSSHHFMHHKHPDHHHDDMDYHIRSEESMYSYDHHHPDHSHHHRVHHYVDHPSTRSFDCMEVCEKCKMKAHRHRYGMSREHDVTRSGGGTPLVSQAPTVSNTPKPAVNGHGGYLVHESQEFKPVLGPGELRDTPSSYGGTKDLQDERYGSYIFPKPVEHGIVSSAGNLNSAHSTSHYQDQTTGFDSAFPEFMKTKYVPNSSWSNETYYFGKHDDPNGSVVGYHRQRGNVQHMHYVEDGRQNVENGNQDERGRDIRFLNRQRYETTNG